ncbi:MAG: hypothetical protein KDC03_10855 [Flavobacteriales bacterium]|nr:hypothetical protein [Flavobacteriales bacterium]
MHQARSLAVLTAFAACSVLLAQDDDAEYVEEVVRVEESVYFLPVAGRVSDGDKKLAECEVLVYQGNDLISTNTTDRAGRFGLELDLGPEYMLEFQREGFMPKRIMVDTRTDIPLEKLVYGPLALDVSLLAAEKYTGVDTDVLDFPFAIVRYDKRQHTYAADADYTMGMQRTNGALLLMAGRVGE